MTKKIVIMFKNGLKAKVIQRFVVISFFVKVVL